MVEQGYITHAQYVEGIHKALPAPADIKPPTLESQGAPTSPPSCASSWSNATAPRRPTSAASKSTSTLDLQLQEAAEEAVNSYLGYSPATASVVVIDDHTGGIKAMVGGPDFETAPFNLATQGRRQPGSSIKPFTLLTALEEGISPDTEFPSEQRTFHFGKHGQETFTVHNDEEGYLGSCSISCGLTYSDNSIYAGLALEGLEGKTIEDRTRSIAKTIHKAGYNDPISTNPAMVARRPEGRRLAARLGLRLLDDRQQRRPHLRHPRPRPRRQPGRLHRSDQERQADQGRRKQADPPPGLQRRNRRRGRRGSWKRWSPRAPGPRPRPAPPEEWGKTGTTEEEGDAWFCGGVAAEVTACVWVGYPDTTTPMLDPLQRRPGDGRHLPGADLEPRDHRLGRNQERTPGRKESQGKGEGRKGKRRQVELRSRRRNRSRRIRRNRYVAPEESYEGEEFVPEEEVEDGGTGGAGRGETEAPVEEAAGRSGAGRTGSAEAAPEETAPATGGGVTAVLRTGCGSAGRATPSLTTAGRFVQGSPLRRYAGRGPDT